MHERSLLAVGLVAVVLLAGCLSGGPGGTVTAPETPATTAPGAASPGTVTGAPEATDTRTGTGANTGTGTPSPDGTAVEYVIRPGEIPDDVSSVAVTLQAVFVTDTADLGPCYPEVFSGPYKPTITPLRTPSGECLRSEPVTIDLAATEGDRPVEVTAPARAEGHALLVTEITATRENGSDVDGIKGTGGVDLLAISERPEGRYGVEIGLERVDTDAPYDYWLELGRFEPSG